MSIIIFQSGVVNCKVGLDRGRFKLYLSMGSLLVQTIISKCDLFQNTSQKRIKQEIHKQYVPKLVRLLILLKYFFSYNTETQSY